jgi:hypothetical protein
LRRRSGRGGAGGTNQQGAKEQSLVGGSGKDQLSRRGFVRDANPGEGDPAREGKKTQVCPNWLTTLPFYKIFLIPLSCR